MFIDSKTFEMIYLVEPQSGYTLIPQLSAQFLVLDFYVTSPTYSVSYSWIVSPIAKSSINHLPTDFPCCGIFTAKLKL